MSSSSSSENTMAATQVWKDWCAIVDHVAAEERRDPLPSSYTTESFLPEDAGTTTLPALTNTLVHALIQQEWARNKQDLPPSPGAAAEDDRNDPVLCSFEDAAKRWFQPQMTMTESLHAKPLVPHFSSHAMDQLQRLPPPPSSISGRQRKSRRTEGSHNEDDTEHEESPFANVVEGPNFLQLVQQSVDSATASSMSSSLSSSAPASRPATTRWSGRHFSTSQRSDRSALGAAVPPMRAPLSTRLNSGFVNPLFYAAIHRQPNFMPIVLVPAAVTAPIQLMNVKRFLEEGVFADPTTFFIDHETGAASVMQSKPEWEVVSSERFKRNLTTRVAFTKFRVVDDPSQIENWEHVCAALVTGQEWEFQTWFPQEHRSLCQPSHLFNRISGYLAYFEENKIPLAVQQWNVHALILTKRVVKAQQHIRLAAQFWDTLFSFLDRHPLFNKFTVPLEE